MPTLNVAEYVAKTYADPPCWSLVTDVYVNVLSLPVFEFSTINAGVREMAQALRLHLHKAREGFRQVAEPVDFAVVLMGRRRLGMFHCGIYYGGSVLHALTPTQTLYQDLASLGDAYDMMEFWVR